MKTRAMLFVVAATAVACSSNKIAPAKVPSVVVNTLHVQHPEAANVEWERDNGVYEAEWDVNDSTDVTVRIDPSGKVLAKKQDVAIAGLPAGMVQSIQTLYPGYRVDDVEQLAMSGSTFYQAELESGQGKDLKIVFREDGQVAADIPYWD